MSVNITTLFFDMCRGIVECGNVLSKVNKSCQFVIVP